LKQLGHGLGAARHMRLVEAGRRDAGDAHERLEVGRTWGMSAATRSRMAWIWSGVSTSSVTVRPYRSTFEPGSLGARPMSGSRCRGCR
jgi:hypothetical protein